MTVFSSLVCVIIAIAVFSSSLNLDAWINEPQPDSDEEEQSPSNKSWEIFYKSSVLASDFRDTGGYQAESGAIEIPEEELQLVHN